MRIGASLEIEAENGERKMVYGWEWRKENILADEKRCTFEIQAENSIRIMVGRLKKILEEIFILADEKRRTFSYKGEGI